MAWWDTDWPARFAITTDAALVDEDIGVYSFPLSLAPAEFWAAVRSDGGDIRVTTDADAQVPIDVDPWDYSGETGRLHIKATVSISADTTLYVYYGNAAATTESAAGTYGSEAVWSGFSVVLNLSETGGTTAIDRTANGNDATHNGSMTSADNVAGPTTDIPALDLDGTDDWLSITGATNVDADTHTISLWMYKDAAAATWFYSMGSDATFANRHMRIQDMDFGGPFRLRMYQNFSTTEGQFRHNTSGEFPAVTTWFKLDITYDASSTANVPKMYKNGVQVTALGVQTTPVGTRSASTDDIGIGRPSWGETPWNGKIAAFRLANVVRSANYIATVYDMEANAATFWTTGAEEEVFYQTGLTYAGSSATVTPGVVGSGDVTWTNIGNIVGSNASTYANASIDDQYTYAAHATNYDFSAIPSGSTPVSLTAYVHRYGSGSGRARDLGIYWIIGGTATGANKAITTTWPSTAATATYTWSAANGDTMPSLAQLQASNFGIEVQAQEIDAASESVRLYYVGIDVAYTLGASGNTGTGALSAPAGTLSGAGTQTVQSDGAITSPVAEVDGAGIVGKTGTGALSALVGEIDGSGIVGKTGTGALAGYVGEIDGVGITGRTGSGALSVSPATLSGAGTQTVTGTGALTGYVGEIDGAGTAGVQINGTGNINNPMPSILADGDIVSGDQDLVGALDAPAGVVEGYVVTGKTGTAALTHPMPVVLASGTQTISGTGALTAPSSYVVSGSGLLSPPDAVGTAGLVAPASEVSGAGFVLDASALSVDSIAWYLTGADAAGKSQRNQALSLGGFRSGVAVKSMTWDCRQPMVGVEILGVGALNGRGTGSLEAVTDNSLRWTPPEGLAGTTVTLAQGQEAKLFGFQSGAWIHVRRNSTLPMVGTHSVQCMDIYNNAIGLGNVASADAVAGEVFYRAVIGKNEFDGPMVDFKIWLDADANTGIAIGYEAAVADEIQTIADETTAPTGITWVTGTTSATGISVPSVVAGGSFGIWIRKTIAADTAPSPRELVHIHVQYGDLVPTTRLDDLRGKYRIARSDYVTYGLWVGQDAEPDFDVAADEEFVTLPHTTTLSLDPDHVYYGVVRQRNKWGLWSQNMKSTALPMDAAGDQGFVAPHAPSIIAITQSGDNYPIFSARYEPSQDTALANSSRNDPGRAEIFVLWYTRDDSTPDPTDTPSAYGLMGTRAGVETLKYTETGTAFLDETPVKALVRTRRLAVGPGDAFSPDTTQLPASGSGTIVVASELAGWDSTGYLKVTTFAGGLQEVVEYSNLVVGAGISTFTVGSGGRGLWGTTAAATVTNNVIYPVTPVDSENATVTEYAIDGIAPGRPWGELLFGTDGAQEQSPVDGPDGVTEEYISVPNDHYLLLGEGWCELWMGSDLVWKVFQDGNLTDLNGLYIPSEWTITTGSISGASTGVFDSASSTALYIVAGLVRRVYINSSAMTITLPSFSSLGGIPEVAPQSSTWEQYAGTLLQSWDPERQDYRPYAQLTTAGLLTSQWTVYNDLTQAEIVAL